ncbi:MAG: DUF2269 family protein [Actinomycetota bacterium]
MDLYEVLLFVHILGAAVWVGGSIMLGFISSRVEKTGDAQYRARFAQSAGVVGPVIGISALLLLGTGIGMVLDSEAVELGQTWVWLGLALFGLSAVVGGAYFAPASNKIVAALEAGQVQEADRRAKQFNMVSRLDMLLLLVIVGVMVFKPGG